MLFIVIYNFNTVDFSNTPSLNFQAGAAAQNLLAIPISVAVGAGVSTYSLQLPTDFAGSALDATPALNQPINLTFSSGAFALAGIGVATLGAGGTGYAIGDTGTITTGNGDATYEVLTVSGLGAVLTFKITFPGSGYAVANGQATATGGAQPGVGINFTVDVTSLVNGDGALKVTTLYKVIDVP